jgi:hypothetical protein
MIDAFGLFAPAVKSKQRLIMRRCFMSGRKLALALMVGFGATAALTPAAMSGQKVDLKTPGATIDVLGGNKLIKAGDAKIKVKPGKHGDCVRIGAGNVKVGTGKIKNGECKG